VAWSPDGQKLAFGSYRDGITSDLYVINADGAGVVNRLTTNTDDDAEPDWQPVPSADLSVALAASPDAAISKKPLTYTITVANAGPTAAKNVVVTDTLPPDTRFSSVTPSRGSCSAPPVGSTGTITCSLGTLAKGDAAVTSIVVKVVARKGTITNTATVASTTSDPVSANNSASVTTRVK
jgi:uncharacterized repeat protein (TIGR01451 family)